MITNEALYLEATSKLLSAPISDLGVWRQSRTSRDISKPGNTAALFHSKSRYELHASRTCGQMKARVWVYHNSVLCHEAVDADVCARVVELSDRVDPSAANRFKK
jgi:hypothetical protein